ncbi:MAG: DNA-binding transcriptional regulator Fis [Gammaproteobacteria bacterium]|nr:DNA-binding transcriptional regulator Fis [Gammaproteobacteria bacterium]
MKQALSTQAGKRARTERRSEPLRSCVECSLRRYFKDLNGHRPSGLYQLVMRETERPLLEMVMVYTRGNQSQAAEILGINRNTLRKKLKLYGIH